ncbi:MAG: hypothetical protein IK126_02680 [Bacteroidales bacterium]|nr:hypothetical protein [Bacteroidales bacterium]
MKRILILVTLMAVSLMVSAQTFQDNSKRTVILGEVAGKKAESVKYAMLKGLTETKRLNIFDSRHFYRLPKKIRESIEVDAVITAQVDSIITKKVTKRAKDKNGNHYTEWTSKSYVTLLVRDPATNIERIRHRISGYGSDLTNSKEAEAAAITTLSVDLSRFIDSYYLIHSEIITVNEVKNNKAQTVTINVGSASSIYGNMQFYVYPKGSKDKIGSLKVKEINSSDKTTCEVKSGGDAILKAIEEGKTLTAVSHTLDVVTDIITFEKKTSPIINEPKPDCNKRHIVLYLGSVGNNELNGVIDNDVIYKISGTERLTLITASQWNSLSDEEKASMSIDGLLISVTGDKMTTTEKRDKYIYYSTKIDFMLILSDIHTGEILFADNYISSGSSTSSEADAIFKASKHNTINVDNLIDVAYPIYSTIVTMDEANAKKAKEVTIKVGSTSSVYKGMKLKVYTKNTSNDWVEIGELKVKEIINETHSSCKVSDGGAEIKKAFEDGLVNRVVTKPKSLLERLF